MTWTTNLNSRKPKFVWEYLPAANDHQKQTVVANTKSEARAILKSKLGKLPAGARIVHIVKVEEME